MKKYYFFLLKTDNFLGFNDNLGQNICILSRFLAQFIFTTRKTELDYYHQKVNI